MNRFKSINGEKPIIETSKHHNGGKQHIITFKNGYSASVIPEFVFSNTEDGFKTTVVDGFYECAVFYNQKLDYSTEITNDVLRNLNDPELQNIVEQIQRLPKPTEQKEGSFYGYKAKHDNYYPELDD
tara:strand:- start:74 stop:454 length:381 start_codon:yes stop_codon:yes gene_type:complete